ncbi:DinB family protein [bacterium]|nr:MAG: DinB family protein [bacterium]
MQAIGLRNVPVTVVGDKAVVGFDRRELTRLFQLSDRKDRPVAGPWLFGTFDKILAAVIRAVRQIPPERALWTTPDRDRPLKVFCYHVLADPIHVLEAIASGKYDGTFKLTYGEASERFATMEEVAWFGEECRARIKQASQQLSAAELERPIKGYAGETNGHELLCQVLSHTAHHLRQLYEMLRMIGVEPGNPLGEKEFEGISMPKALW